MHILYVEDNPLDADMLTRELTRQAPQINAERAATYAEAAARLEICTPEQPVYDLVLTDMHLPDESGLALLPLLHQRGLNLAVVVLTGQGNDEAVVAALKAGASDYVVKRGDYLARLPAILEAALQRHQTETARRARPLRVLYAEGRAADSALTQHHFARHVPHLQLEIVNSAEAVLRRLSAAQRASTTLGDVLLLDYHLPGLNGLELMKELLHTPGFDLPIVFVTDQNSEEIALQALRLGAMDYVVKQPDYLPRLPVILENAFYRVQLSREQAALRRSEEYFRSLIENASDIILVLDAEGVIHYISPAIQRLRGCAPRELMGLNGMQLFHPDDEARIRDTWLSALRQPGVVSAPVVVRSRQADGAWRCLEAVGKCLVNEAGQKLVVFNFRDITERKQAEAEIRRLSSFPQSNPTPILEINLAGEIIYANPASLTTLAQLGVTDPHALLPPDFAAILAAADAAHTQFFREVEIKQRAFGETIYYTPEFQSFRLYARDITERLQAEAALRASEQRYRTLIENQGEGIAILDDEEGFLFANPAARSIFGVAPDDLLGRNLREFLTPEQFALVTTETRDYLRQGEKTTYELKIKRPDGQRRDLLVTASPQTGPDRVFSATFSIFRDITERKQAERALQRLNVELEQRVGARTAELRDANVALAHAARLKDEFLASMSHELRTPLTGILNLAEALQEQVYGPQNEKQLKSLRTIEDSGRHLLGLINDILDLSKIEAGQLQLQIEDCAVGEICQSSLQLVKGMAQKKRQTVSFDCRSEAIYLRADARRLKQMLVNLLSNAVKFTPEDGPIGLRVEADANARVVRFTVWDTGLGIAAADLPKLFQPFTQLDGSLARQQAGTGLGLALVRRMAELHGGSVSVESAPGQGSRFIITLPWVSSSVAVPQHKRTAGLLRHTQLMGVGRAHLTDTHQAFLILLVDDNETNIRTYTDYFETKGFQVAVARQGEEAVRLAVTLQPDLILMDVQLPGMDGLEATLRIRHHPDRRVAALPIIALTALAMPGDRERCLAAGANEYLSKPVGLTVLVKTVETLLTRTYSSSVPVN